MLKATAIARLILEYRNLHTETHKHTHTHTHTHIPTHTHKCVRTRTLELKVLRNSLSTLQKAADSLATNSSDDNPSLKMIRLCACRPFSPEVLAIESKHHVQIITSWKRSPVEIRQTRTNIESKYIPQHHNSRGCWLLLAG